MNKESFDKYSITNLFSQLKTAINKKLNEIEAEGLINNKNKNKLSLKYEEGIKKLSKEAFKDLGISEGKNSAFRVASNYIRNCL